MKPGSSRAEDGERQLTPLEVGHGRRPVHWILGGFLALLFLTLQGLIIFSYRQASTTSKQLQTATESTTTLANLQRESLLLQGLVLRMEGPQQAGEIELRRQLLQRQLGVLEANLGASELEPYMSSFLEALDRFDQHFAALQTLRSFSNDHARGSLLTPLLDLEVLSKQLFDEKEKDLYGAIHDDLKQAERGQLLLGALSGVVLVLGFVLAFFLRRSVRSSFARAHAALLKEMREREILQRQLSHQAYHDPLTGLANRELFLREIKRCMARSERAGCDSAVIYLDLDDFKSVNDSFGHLAGDDLLKSVSARLEGCIRATDTAARLGGDEFAILLESAGEPSDVIGVVERIVTAVKEPVQLGEHVYHPSASIGVVPVVDPKTDVDQVIKNADIAMYEAKADGKGVYVVFEEAMRIRKGQRASMEVELRRAIREKEFVCFYQPIVDLKSQRLQGVEALVRWQHRSGELMPPAHFLPTAEETGLIGEIGELVLREAASTMAGWIEMLPRDRRPFVSVNFSTQQLQDPEFSQRVTEILQESGLPPDCLVIEITENTMMQETELAASVLGEVRELGVRVAVDDFGIGYSSLSYLRFLPIDILKIDRSFTAALPEDYAIAATIVNLADTLGMTSLAEGIEREEQRQRLEHIGCTLGQGFLIARPQPAALMWRSIDSTAESLLAS